MVRLYVFPETVTLAFSSPVVNQHRYLRLGMSINGKIHENEGPAIVEAWKMGVALKVGKHIVYEKSRELLLRLRDGSRWIE